MDYAFAVKPKKQGPRMAEAFTFGIEEEYFLVDAATKVLARDVPPAFFDDAKKASDGRISTEFLQPQVEVITSPHIHLEDARVELRTLRRTASTVAARHGLAILAAGTHPTAFWREAQQTDKQRYDTVMDDLQMIGQRDLLCGLHVHVELPDPDQRVDVMYRILPYLPLLLALSTFCRTSLSLDPSADVSLAEEIDLQRLYLDIEMARFPDRLTVEIDVPSELEQARMPALILQPIVENAIKYGVSKSRKAVVIRIEARHLDNHRMLLEISNRLKHGGKEELPVATHEGTGLGLANVCQRLEARWGSRASCRFGPMKGGGFKVSLTMPVETNG